MKCLNPRILNLKDRLSILKTQTSSPSGFTLIELLVVFSLIAVLSGLGLVSFVAYSRSQQVNQTANNLKLMINEARSHALSGVKTNQDITRATINCSGQSLSGYSINIIGNSELDISQLCTNTIPALIKRYNVPTNISLSGSCTQINFDALTTTASGAPLPCTVVVSGYNQSKTLTVDSVGNVSIQ